MDTTTTLGYADKIPNVGEFPQQIFGELVKLAIPVIKAYHCDLFYDAQWIVEYVKGTSCTFYWSVDECGTLIGEDEKLVGQRKHLYRITLSVNDRGKCTMRIQGA